MRRMLLGFGLAALTLVALPILPDFVTTATRVFTLLAVAALFLLAYLAYVPVRITVGFLRVFALMAGMGFAYADLLLAKHLDVPEVALASVFALGGLVLAIGPFLALSARRKLYFGSIVWLWLVAALLVSTLSQLWASSLGALGLILVPLAARLGWELARWEKTGQSSIPRELERHRGESWRILAELRLGSSKRAMAAWHEREFCARLVEMRKQEAGAIERYEDLIRICRNYPQVPLAWRLAYSAAMSRGDRSLAHELVKACEGSGHGEALDIFGTSSPEAPWLAWRDADRSFEKAQDQLASLGLPLKAATL